MKFGNLIALIIMTYNESGRDAVMDLMDNEFFCYHHVFEVKELKQYDTVKLKRDIMGLVIHLLEALDEEGVSFDERFNRGALR